MSSQVDDLVRMRDTETLYELMSEDEDWMIQLDAAEGLVKLGDRRGLDFILSTKESEDTEIRSVAREILDSPAIKRMIEDIKAEERRERHGMVETARKRLQKGKKVFLYKMVFLPIGELLDEDPASEGFYIPGLINLGFEGWEMVNMMPRHSQQLGGADQYLSGAYFLLKREVAADESAELDEV